MENQLPAGLLNDHYEFFASPELHAYCLTHGIVIRFEDMGEPVLDAIYEQITRHPAKIVALHMLGILDRKEQIRQFLICNYGGFDNQADMIDGVLQQPEYWPCPQRGKCKVEGILCQRIKTRHNQFLSFREIQVIKMIAHGHLDKEIADRLNITLNTVTTHTKNIRSKTGLQRKADITRFAYQNHIAS